MVNQHKMQGMVSDPAENQEPDIHDSGVEYDPSQVTDPGEDQLSKGQTETKGD